MSVISDHDHSLPLPPMSEEGESMCFWKAMPQVSEGYEACSAALRHPWATYNCTTSPRVPISEQRALPEMVVKRTVKRRDLVKLHLMAKQQLTNQTAQFGLLVFSSVITSASATFTAKGLAIETETSFSRHYQQGLGGKDEHPGSSKDFSSRGRVHALLLSKFQAPFSLTPFPPRQVLFLQTEQHYFNIHLTQDA